jgi:prophage regulatory protein
MKVQRTNPAAATAPSLVKGGAAVVVTLAKIEGRIGLDQHPPDTTSGDSTITRHSDRQRHSAMTNDTTATTDPLASSHIPLTARSRSKGRDTEFPDRILRLPEVMRLTSLSKTTIWELEKAGNFPQRRQLTGKAVGWKESEIVAWIDGLAPPANTTSAEPTRRRAVAV